MLSNEENRLLTQAGPNTPGGRLLRSFWQPVALGEELKPERPVLTVQVMGEELLLFRDEQGRLGLIDRWCSHRGADLRFGRIEDGGIRCVYHGWNYDVNGRCLDQPGEPVKTRFCDKIKHKAYPCREANGVVYAYMGAGEPPPLPAFDWITAPVEHVHVFKVEVECNYWQAMEGNIDPAHHSFLHRFVQDAVPEDAVYAKAFVAPAPGATTPWSKIMRDYRTPHIEAQDTDYGFRIGTVRDLGSEGYHVRVTNYIVPSAGVVGVGEGMGLCLWHVPIDDTRHWRYEIIYSYRQPIDKPAMRTSYARTYGDDWKLKRNKHNAYLYDPAEQKDWTFIGVGYEFGVHDSVAVEGQTIVDRTKEHLGSTDKMIVKARRLLFKLMKDVDEGRADSLPLRLRDPNENKFDHVASVDRVYPADKDWRISWKEDQLALREQSPWASKLDTCNLSQ